MTAPLTDREKGYVAIALSNYADVQTHVVGRLAELLDLASKLEIHHGLLSKGLLKAALRRHEEDAEARAAAVAELGGEA